MRLVILLLIILPLLVAVAHAEPMTSVQIRPEKDYAGEIQQTLTDWGKQQFSDTIKKIFKTRQDEQEEKNRRTFGIMIIQAGYVAVYGWLIAFIMPDKVAALMRTTAFMGCLQYIAEYVTTIS